MVFDGNKEMGDCEKIGYLWIKRGDRGYVKMFWDIFSIFAKVKIQEKYLD